MSQPVSYSLRRRLAWLLTSSVAAIWLLSALLVFQRAHHQADALLDAQLTQVADTLLAIVAGGGGEAFVGGGAARRPHGTGGAGWGVFVRRGGWFVERRQRLRIQHTDLAHQCINWPQGVPHAPPYRQRHQR